MIRSYRTRFVLAVMAVATLAFWRTAYPTITWWDSGNYSLAADSLGITSAPGSLLLTLLGWPLTKLPLGLSAARVLNLFAGALAAMTTGLVFVVALRLRRATIPATANGEESRAALAGAAVGALTFAFSATLWEHAIKFTPYVLTALFTALILWTLLRWWEDADDPRGLRWLLLLGVLFGLDFSVHRTNALLIPGALVWIAMRRPRTLMTPRAVLTGSAGMLAGLAVNLLIIPIARYTSSPLNMYQPDNLSSYWSYISLKALGGNFLVNVWPRKSGFLSVQVADIVRTFADNFLHWNTSASLLGILPAIAIAIGLLVLYRRSRQLAIAWVMLLALQAACTVIYFNIPANYFRPFDRHYLPVFVTLGVTIAFGLSVVAEQLAVIAPRRRALAFAGAALVALVPLAQLGGNWQSHDASKRYFTADFARNALESLPLNAIYFTVGDNDTFPVMYMQSVEGVRPDVRILNFSLMGVDSYIDQLVRRDPAFPVSLSAAQRLAQVSAPHDSMLVVPVAGTPDTVRVRARPSYGSAYMVSDIVLMDIVSTNQWRRPIAFAITSGRAFGWLEPHAKLDGLHWRILPAVDPREAPDTLRRNLLARYEYRGYADSSTRIDDVSRTMAYQYYAAFKTLFGEDKASGRTDDCRGALDKYIGAFPPERMRFGPGFADEVRRSCG